MGPVFTFRERFLEAAIAMLALAAVGCAEPIDLKLHALNAGSGVVAGAHVEILGEGFESDFDQNGTLYVPAFRIHGRHGFKVTAPGYETTFRVFDLKPGLSHEFTIRMRPLPAPQRVMLPPVGEQVAVKEGISSLTLRGGGLVHKDGREVTGAVDVLVVPFDPVAREEPPASMVTDTGKQLMSLGMATITITQDGEELQPKTGMPLEWQMAINPLLRPLDTLSAYKMYYVDEKTGRWHEDPTATLKHPYVPPGETDHWVATLPHLSVWNADVAFEPSSCINGSVIDAHNQYYRGTASVSAVDVSVGNSIYAMNCSNDPCPPTLRAEGECDFCDPTYGVIAYSYTAYVQGGSFHVPVPTIAAKFREHLEPIYGLVVLPMRITLGSVALAGQKLGSVTIDGNPAALSETQGPITPPDGGCNDVVFRYCLEEGQACAPGDSCCNGQACNAQGKCGPGEPVKPVDPTPMCHALNTSCTNVSECCSGIPYCIGNVCRACLPYGANGCVTTADCCGGTCVNGTCSSCSDSGSSCSSNGQCCFGNSCVQPDEGMSAQPGVDGTCQSCIPDGHRTCSSRSDCCSNALCDNGTCRSCIGSGGTCSTQADCCGGGLCISGSCQTCVPAGQSCSLGNCCGGLNCFLPNNTCQACSFKGAVCNTGGDCCSGSCQDKTCD